MATATATPREITARFNSVCPRCGGKINKGVSRIRKAIVDGRMRYVHASCTTDADGDIPEGTPSDRTDSDSSPAGARKRRVCPSDRMCQKCKHTIREGKVMVLWTDGPVAKVGKKGTNCYHWIHDDCATAGAGSPATSTVPSGDIANIAAEVRRQLSEALNSADFAAIDAEIQKLIDEKCKPIVALAESVRKVEIEIKGTDGETRTYDGLVHECFEEILRLCSVRKDDGSRLNIFLPGPSGCGKSHVARQVAEAMGLPFYSISCSQGMSEGQLTGKLLPIEPTPDQIAARHARFVEAGFDAETSATLAASAGGGAFSYMVVDFVRAYEQGGVFLLDEMDAADSNVMLVVNGATANGHLPLPNRPENPIAKRHADFILIAAANTFGKGADRIYVGRNQLDGATLDRFRMGTIPMDYSRKLEETLCPDEALRRRVWTIREKAAESKLRVIVSTRFLAEAFTVKTQLNETDEYCIRKLTADWSADERAKIGS